MRLTPTTLEAFCQLVAPDLGGAALGEYMQEFRDSVAGGERSYDDCFVVESEDGCIAGAVSLVRIRQDSFAITAPRVLKDAPDGDSLRVQLIREALSGALDQCGRRVYIRVEDRGPTSRVARALKTLGFTAEGRRLEFRTPVADLPDDHGTPLSWQPMGTPSCPSRAEAAAVLHSAAEGDPDWDADDEPREVLDGFLDEAELYGEPDCVQVASIGGDKVGLVIAQAARASGWSRLTYLGVLPEFRGRGYGRWVQRHGFAMLKAQGGVEYHGGTSEQNAPMLALFREHGCVLERTVSEWLFVAP